LKTFSHDGTKIQKHALARQLVNIQIQQIIWGVGINIKYIKHSVLIFQTYLITVDKSIDVNDPAQLAVNIHSCK
jgi:hypothetical protein